MKFLLRLWSGVFGSVGRLWPKNWRGYFSFLFDWFFFRSTVAHQPLEFKSIQCINFFYLFAFQMNFSFLLCDLMPIFHLDKIKLIPYEIWMFCMQSVRFVFILYVALANNVADDVSGWHSRQEPLLFRIDGLLLVLMMYAEFVVILFIFLFLCLTLTLLWLVLLWYDHGSPLSMVILDFLRALQWVHPYG